MPIASDKVASLPSSAVVVIPCLNEEGYIQGVIDHFAAEFSARFERSSLRMVEARIER